MHDAPAKRRFRWFRFSLWTMLILVMLVGIGLAFLLRWDDRAKRQQQAVAALSSNSANAIWYENELDPEIDPAPVPEWLSGLLSFHHFYNVVDVALHEATDDQI